uniref:Secreted protein n=1 Tax=Plectus sambesii TaxID=2011161 RepID=A0A914XQ65_9BILA
MMMVQVDAENAVLVAILVYVATSRFISSPIRSGARDTAYLRKDGQGTRPTKMGERTARISVHEELGCRELDWGHEAGWVTWPMQHSECRRRPLANATAARSVDSICERAAVAAAQQLARNDSGASSLGECQ